MPINWNQVNEFAPTQYSLSRAKIRQWFNSNNATLTMRAYGPKEDEQFTTDLMYILDEINSQKVTP